MINFNDTYTAGYTLDREAYVSDRIFASDMARIFNRSWCLVGHVSQLPEIGSFFTVDLHGESIILARGTAGIQALYNVCAHRGSRVCLERAGKAQAFICPYHGWRYRLDGLLLRAPLMPDDFDRGANGLQKAACHVFEGMIFVSLMDGPGDFEAHYADMRKFLAWQKLSEAKVIAIKDIPVKANWKLVNENFLECYHCAGTHPQFVAVHDREQFAAMSGGSREDIEKYAQILAAWETKAQTLGHLTGSIGRETSGLYDFAMAFRQPLRESCFSETREGFKVAPLLGLENWDGGVTMVLFNPFTQIFLSNDHATMFSFFPKGPLETVIRIWWLVAGKAEAGVDYNVDDITYMWTVTTEQDRDLVEANQAGVSSHRFRRGRYSEMEKGPIMLLNWYVNQMRDAGAGH